MASSEAKVIRCAIALAVFGWVSACDDDESEEEHGDHGHESTDGDATGGHDHETGDTGHHGETAGTEACTGDEEMVAAGASRAGEHVRVTLLSLDPEAPIRGDNSWVVRVSDLDEQALTGVDFTIEPWMPAHGHGTPVQAEVTEREDGEYVVEPLNLFMAGVWEVRFKFNLPDNVSDEAVLSTCVE